jgi:hypothetical protein
MLGLKTDFTVNETEQMTNKTKEKLQNPDLR